MLQVLERIEQIFTGPVNPEEEVSVGLFKLRVPAYPLDVVREAVLNAITPRDYSDPGEVLIRHSPRELAVTSAGGFLGGITVHNILRHEPVARNRTLANAFLKLRLVESAGTGRRRIFVTMLNYGKRVPRYESDGYRVTLRLFDGAFDARMATLVAKWNQTGHEIDLDGLLALTWLKEHSSIDARTAADVLQMDREGALRILDRLSRPAVGILERRGRTKGVTYYLVKDVADDLLGRAAYTRDKGISATRYAALVQEYLRDNESIANREVRALLGLGDSLAASTDASRLLAKWSGPSGFLHVAGKGRWCRYRLRQTAGPRT